MSLDLFLPLLTYPDPTPATGVTSAVELAALLGGRLTVSTHVVDVPRITNPLAGGVIDYAGMAAAAEASSGEAANRISDYARTEAERREVPVSMDAFRVRPYEVADHLAAAARSHDLSLTIVDPQSRGHVEAAEALLFGSGGPVGLLPGERRRTRLELIAIAWDGGRAAARAVRDSLPILRMGSGVVVLTAADDKPIAPAGVAGLLAYLEGHGIAAVHQPIATGNHPLGQRLQAEAIIHEADLLVMGAFGHNRLLEFVLGGVTRSILDELRLPILMSH